MRASRADLRSLTLPARRGFTLVELLVAVGIMLVLIGLALLVVNSGVIGNARTSGGSDRIAGWLMQAREKAKRDGAPRGIRFIVGPDGFVREAQLIEVPEPYIVPPPAVTTPPTPATQLMIEHVRPAGGAETKRVFVVGSNAADVIANVTTDETLSIPSTGTIHRLAAPPSTVAGGISINGVAYPAVLIQVVNPALLPDLGAAALTAVPATPTPTYATPTFGFLRQARPTFGEPPYQLPDTVAIDPSLCQPTFAGSLDVLFGPNGELQNTGGLGQVILWTRNPEALATSPRAGGDLRTTYESAGEMRLIVVYTRTGSVAVQPVNLPTDDTPGPHDPYSTTKDGIASGL